MATINMNEITKQYTLQISSELHYNKLCIMKMERNSGTNTVLCLGCNV